MANNHIIDILDSYKRTKKLCRITTVTPWSAGNTSFLTGEVVNYDDSFVTIRTIFNELLTVNIKKIEFIQDAPPEKDKDKAENGEVLDED